AHARGGAAGGPAPTGARRAVGGVKRACQRPSQPDRNSTSPQVPRALPQQAPPRRFGAYPELDQVLAPPFELAAGAQPGQLGPKSLQALDPPPQEAWQRLAEPDPPRGKPFRLPREQPRGLASTPSLRRG